MKLACTLVSAIIALSVSAQDKDNYIRYNKLTDLKGTDYVIATVSHYGKASREGSHLLFINTKTGESRQADFPQGADIRDIEQVKIDELNLNVVVVGAQTVDLDHKFGIDWSDPQQVIVFSPDGKQRTQITDDRLFVQRSTVNSKTGHIVITGHYDTNGNSKYDKTDKTEIIIYDLTTMKLVSKI